MQTTDQGSPTVIKSIRKLVDQFVSAYNKGNAKALASLFSYSGVLMPPGEPPVNGIEEIKWRFQVFFEGFTFDLRLDSLETYMVGDLYFDRGRYTAFSLPIEGGTPRGGEGEYTFLFEQELPGTWRISAFGTSASTNEGAGDAQDSTGVRNPSAERSYGLAETLAVLRNSEIQGRKSGE